jgi:predicted PurR-regulated permease PerM
MPDLPTPHRRAPSRIDQTLTLIVLAALIVGTFFVLQPFLTALAWAVILTVTAWPLYVRLRSALNRRHNTAALVMVVLIALTLLAPFVVVGVTIAENAEGVGEAVRILAQKGPPSPPEWVASIPFVGERVATYWGGFSHDTARLLDELRKVAEPARKALYTGGATMLAGLLQLALSILLAYFFFRDGDAVAGRLHSAVERIAPTRGAPLMEVAAATVRSVVLGILGTALAQGLLMAVGALIAGVHAAPLLGFLVFLLSPVPVGPPLIWGATAAWLFSEGETGWAIFMFIWGIGIVSTVDNVIRPLIISQGADLPFILVLIGVVGGAVAFGVIGLFLGPVLLAVAYVLIKEWAAYTPPPEPQDGADGPG